MSIIIETERLFLRTWEEKDIEPFYSMNQDPKVIEYLAGPMDIEQVEDFIQKMKIQQQKRNYSLWAVELKSSGEFIGFIGLNYTDWEAHFTPAVEVGWRLDSKYWGNGYAPEGAKACLDYGFNKIGLGEIISFTVPENTNSLRVMDKIGLKRDIKDDFIHPKLPKESRLSQHVLYRLRKEPYLK